MTTLNRRSLRHSIADGLRERVVAGEFGPGDRLPGEPELARSLGVSRSSLRAAIALLEEDGLLRRLHGSGTYVTDRPLMRNDLSRNFGVSSMIAAMGLEPGTVDETCAAEPASPEVASALGIEVGEPTSMLRRVRTAGGRRVVDETDWCRSDLLSPPAMAAAAQGSVYAALAERGAVVHHGVATITPDVAMGDVALRLGVPRGTLLLTLW
jgi:GntR family transcriptional regulator